jgi:predicted nuclease of predicted toxin-antitoxin system
VSVLRILLDNNIHVELAADMAAHEVKHCRDLGWQQLTNGELVKRANERFDLTVTVDKNMRHQTSLRELKLAVVVFGAPNNTIEELRRFVPEFLEKIASFEPGTFTLLRKDLEQT